MKIVLIIYVTLISGLCLVTAAPTGTAPEVKFLNYKDDKEFEKLQRQIIAQYELLGGSSQVHHAQTAKVVDPLNLRINIF